MPQLKTNVYTLGWIEIKRPLLGSQIALGLRDAISTTGHGNTKTLYLVAFF